MARKLLTSAKESVDFVSNKLWKVRINKIQDKRQGFLIKQVRIISLALKKFNADDCLTTATALTFYTIFSIVPILALLFAIAKGFGYEEKLPELQADLLVRYPEYSGVLGSSFTYANSLLSTTEGGIIAGVGIVLLLWSVMKLLISIEEIFNRTWGVKTGRSWVRKVTDYLTIMMIGPILLIVSGGITVAVQNRIGNMNMSFVGTFFIKLLAYALVAGFFIFLFVVLPNTKVRFKSALSAAVLSTILFELLGWGYIKFQIGANRMNAIYGGFAALPLFLIWLQYSWYIVLLGANLAYASQHVDHYELEEEIKNLSARYKKVLSLMIANLVAKRFYNGEKSLTALQISAALDLPSRLTDTLINEFVDTGVFVEVRTEDEKEVVYQPGITESKFTVQYLIDSMERKGVNSLPINDTAELIHINKLMQEMDKAMDTDLGHLYIKDLVKQI
jgi:membrane protein